MATIKIDDKDYELDDLSNSAKEQVASLQFVNGEIKRLEAQMAVFRTAAVGYTAALKKELGD